MGKGLGVNLKETLNLCIKKRVKWFKCPEFEFALELPHSPESEAAAKQLAEIAKTYSDVSDEDILFNPMAGLEDK